MGIGNCESSDPRRLVSCTRNLFAGIILLFKHKLAKLSPPGSDKLPRRKQRGISGNYLTAYAASGGVLDPNENKYRNNIEHYYSSEPHNSIRSLITDCFIVIRNFVREHLKMDPLDLFGADIWKVLTGIVEVYEEEKQECIKHIKSIECEHNKLEVSLIEYRCGECRSGLIDVTSQSSDIFNTKFKCRSCGKNWDFVSIVDQAIPEYFSIQNYLSVKDGGYPVTTATCPTCGLETYVFEEDKCLICGEMASLECQLCGELIMDGGAFCSYCSRERN